MLLIVLKDICASSVDSNAFVHVIGLAKCAVSHCRLSECNNVFNFVNS